MENMMNNFVNKLKTKANRYAELKKQRGMSLLEVIIVLGIIGTMAAAVVILAQRAFDSQDITDLVDNTNTVRVAVNNTYKDAGVYPTTATSPITLVGAAGLASKQGTNAPIASTIVNLGQASEPEVKNGISGDYFFMQGANLTTAAGSTAKGFVLSINGLDQGQCRSLIMQLGNSWDYVEVATAAAGADATLPTELDGAVDITSGKGAAQGILKSFATGGQVQITADAASYACSSTNTNAVLLGSK